MIDSNKIKKAESETHLNPTEKQKKVGNYKKGKITVKGLQITIENPIGSIRSGTDPNGNEWSIKMPCTYGYFNGTIGKDGDQVDVYLNPNIEKEFDVYIIDQTLDSGAFDEHKIMFGFKDEDQAKEYYLKCYEEGWKGFGNITRITLNKFKEWLKNSALNKYPASKLNMSSKKDYVNVNIGDRICLVRIYGEVELDKTLNSLKQQAGNLDDFDKIIVEIASAGGNVAEGLEIMMWLDSLSSIGKEVITVVVANAYSIASLIMLAANIRLISIHGKVMVHNPMLPELKYVNANDLEANIKDLRDLEDSMYDLYEMFTGLDRKKIKSLMDEETYLSPNEAVELGFAHMVVDIKPKPYEMAEINNKDINMSSTINTLNRVIARVNKADFVNQVYTDTNTGSEIEIYQKDQSTYSTGDKTNVESGEFLLPDGAKVKVEDFVITDIDRTVAPEEVQGEFNEGEVPKEVVEEVISPEGGETIAEYEKAPEEAPIEEPAGEPSKVIEKTESTITTKEVQAAEISEVIKWELSVVQDSFELGTKVEFKGFEGEEPYAVGAGEYELEDGRKILTDSEGVVQFIKPAEGSEAKVEEEAPKEEVEAKKEEDGSEIIAKIEAKFEAKIKDLEAKLESVNKFQDVAATAIDNIASNVQSSFKPQAKATVKEAVSGSIFSQALAKKRASKVK